MVISIRDEIVNDAFPPTFLCLSYSINVLQLIYITFVIKQVFLLYVQWRWFFKTLLASTTITVVK